MVIGGVGSGKSTSVYRAFPDSFTIITSPNNQHFYKKRLSGKWKDSGLRPPKKTLLIDTHMMGYSDEYCFLQIGQAKPKVNDKGEIVPVSTVTQVETYFKAIKTKSELAVMRGETPPYRSVIVDELGELLDRVYAELTPGNTNPHTNKHDTRATFMDTTQWATQFSKWCRELTTCGVGVVCVTHDREPEGGRRGGLKAPSAPMAVKIGALADNIIQRKLVDPPPGAKDENGKLLRSDRIWVADASELWDRKFRGLEPEDFDIIEHMELDTIHTLAGFEW